MKFCNRRLASFLLSGCLFVSARAQVPDPIIQQMVNEVSLDSLVHHLQVLTGVESVTLGGETVLITTRVPFTYGNELASRYLRQELGRRTIVFEQAFDYRCSSGPPCDEGLNVWGILPVMGGLFPTIDGPYYIISAHYDSYGGSYPNAPGADDNASGTAVVLEAARAIDKVLEDYGRSYLKFPIVFALWDVEEYGLVGSSFYAEQASAENAEILGVVNLDMLGYDSDDDRNFWFIGSSTHQEFAHTFLPLNDVYEIGLGVGTIRWDRGGSDHKSFDRQGYAAVTLTEGWWIGDSNPYYHANTDTIDRFNLDTYLRMAKLAVAAVAHLALGGEIGSANLSSTEIPHNFNLLQNYPNPFNPITSIRYTIPSPVDVQLEVFDLLGKRVRLLESGFKPSGEYEVTFDATRLSTGIYFYTLTAGDFSQARKMIFLR